MLASFHAEISLQLHRRRGNRASHSCHAAIIKKCGVALILLAVLASPRLYGQENLIWKDGAPIPGTNGSIAAMTIWDPDQGGPRTPVLVVGGLFSTAGNSVTNNIATWDGTAWQPLGNGMNGAVSALTIFEGKLVAGGSFTKVDEISSPGIAHWDGFRWQPLGSGVALSRNQNPEPPPAVVRALTVFNGKLIAGGDFSSAGGQNVNNIAQWDGASWMSMGTGSESSVFSFAIFRSELCVGRREVTPDGKWVSSLVNWNGSTWRESLLDVWFSAIYSLAVYEDRLVIAGPSGIAEWDGRSTRSLGSGLWGSVYSLRKFREKLIAGGLIHRSGDTPLNHIAQWDGSSWQPVGGGTDRFVYALEVFEDELIIGGSFREIEGVSSPSIVRWTGHSWRFLGTGIIETVPNVRAQTVYNGNLVIGGQFTVSDGVGRSSNLAQWNGTSWQSLGGGVDSAAYALAVWKGNLIIGGHFVYAGGGSVRSEHIVLWNGTSWQPMGQGELYNGLGGDVKALAVYKGDLIAGGRFLFASSGLYVNHVARWDGTAWHELGNGLGRHPEGVLALAVFQDKLIAGGYFFESGGNTVQHVAQWDGTSWQPLGAGTDKEVHALTVLDGKLIATGFFREAGDVKANRIAQWDGTQWESLGDGIDNYGYALGVFKDEIYVGGSFSYAGIINARGIARWDGDDWQPLESSLNGTVRGLSIYNGHLVASGSFRRAGDTPAGGLAVWGSASFVGCPKGDVNCDQFVDLSDLDEFINCIFDSTTIDSLTFQTADINSDDLLNGADISEFANLLVSSP